jgi:23S rRNA pseudouridine2605 synthase
VLGEVNEGRLESLKKGITIDGIHYKSILAVPEKGKTGANTWLSVILQEGKNREIRRVMEALDLQVNRLIRVAYGPFNLDDLPKGAAKEVKDHIMRDQIAGYFKGEK